MKAVMIGTSPESLGGVASVVNLYKSVGLLRKYDICYLSTTLSSSLKNKTWVFLKSWVVFLGLLLRGDVKFIHIHIASRNSTYRKLLFIIPAIAFGKKYILHLHGAEYQLFYEDECGPLRKWLIRQAFNRARTVIVLSTQWKKIMSSISSNANIIVVHNPIVVSKKTAVEHPNFNIVFLGRLGNRKGIYDLIEAFQCVVEKIPQARLLCGGDGESCTVQSMVEKFGLQSNYRFLGWISGKEKEDLLRIADIYVLPSYNEGLPMGILEALSFGIPVVTTFVGGIPDAIQEGSEGFLIEPGDKAALADRIIEIASDPILKQKMSKNAYNKAVNVFDIDQIIPKIEMIYDEYEDSGC